MFEKILRLPSRMRLIHVSLILGFTLAFTLVAKHTDKPEKSPELEAKPKVEVETKAYGYGWGTGDQIVWTAEQYLGWSHYDISCSQFTDAVYAEALGENLGSWPARQMDHGYQPWRWRKGDLLFYSEDGYNVTHVAIYAGRGMIIHSSSYYGYVVESDASELDWAYIGARRLR